MQRILVILAILVGLALTSSPASAGWGHRAYAHGYMAGAACMGCAVPVVVARPVYFRGPAFYAAPAFYPAPVFYGGPAYYGAYPAVGLGAGFY